MIYLVCFELHVRLICHEDINYIFDLARKDEKISLNSVATSNIIISTYNTFKRFEDVRSSN